MTRGKEWTPDMRERLKKLWAEGLTAKAAGQKLGVTRSSILGMVRRMDLTRLTGRPKFGGKSGGRVKGSISKKKQATRVLVPPKVRREINRKVIDLPAMPLVSKRLNVLDLGPLTCKWPTAGHGEHTEFCGHTRESGRPYCRAHIAVAYRPDNFPKKRIAR